MAAAVAVALVASVLITHPSEVRGDLEIYRSAVADALSRTPIYPVGEPAGTSPSQFFYPPSALLVLWPLGVLGSGAAAVLWFVVSVASVVASVRLALLRLGRRVDDSSAWALVTWTLITWCVVWGLLVGQVSPLLLVLCAADLLRARESRWSGTLVGVAAAIKITPALFLVWLWLSGRRRAAVTGAATWLGLTAVGWILMPSDSAQFWLHGRVSDLSANASPVNTNIQSVAAFAYRLTGVGSVTESFLITVVVSVLGLAAAWRLSRAGARVAAPALVGVTAAAAAPIGWTHQFVWVPILVVSLWCEVPRATTRAAVLLLAAVVSVPLFVLVPWVVLPTDPIPVRVASGAYVLASLLAVAVVLRAQRGPRATHAGGDACVAQGVQP